MMSLSTVVPALGDPRRERPPAVYGHVANVPTHFNVKLPLISSHLPNADADSYLLVVSTCYNGQCKQMPHFGWSFQSLAHTQTWDRQFAQISVLSSGGQRAICPVIETDEPCDCDKPTPSLVTFVSRHQRKSHVPAMLKNRTILSLDQRIEMLCRLGEAHHVECLLPSQCSKTQMARMISKQTRKATVAYVEYKHSHTGCTVGLQYRSCCFIHFRFTTIAYIIMTMRVFIGNIAGGDSSR